MILQKLQGNVLKWIYFELLTDSKTYCSFIKAGNLTGSSVFYIYGVMRYHQNMFILWQRDTRRGEVKAMDKSLKLREWLKLSETEGGRKQNRAGNRVRMTERVQNEGELAWKPYVNPASNIVVLCVSQSWCILQWEAVKLAAIQLL